MSDYEKQLNLRNRAAVAHGMLLGLAYMTAFGIVGWAGFWIGRLRGWW